MNSYKAVYINNHFFSLHAVADDEEEALVKTDNGDLNYAIVQGRDRMEAEVKAFKIAYKREMELEKKQS